MTKKKKIQTELCFRDASLETDQMNNSLYATEMQRSQENPVKYTEET